MPSSDYFPLRLPGLLTHIQRNKPAEWENYFIGQIGSVDEIVDRPASDLEDVIRTESYADNPLAYFGVLSAIASSTQTMFMVASTVGRIQFVHNIQISRFRDGSHSFVALSGFSSNASPVIIPHEAFIQSKPVQGPPTSSIVKNKSFSSDGVADDDLVPYSSRSIIPLPHFISSFLLGTDMIDVNNNVSAVDILLASMAACDSLDTAVDKHHIAQLDWHSSIELLAPFLSLTDSAVTNGFGVDLSRAAKVTTSLANWASKCHSVLGESSDAAATASAATIVHTAASTTAPTPRHHHTTTLPSGTTNTSTNVGLAVNPATQPIQDDAFVQQLKVNYTQQLSLQRTLEEVLTKDKAETNQVKKAWNKIAVGKRRMALAAASTDGENPATDLPESGLEFLTASASSAKSILESSVQSRFPRFLISYQPLLVQHLRALLLIWSASDIPDGFSIFFTPSCRPEVGESRLAIAASLEELNSAGFSAETVQAQTRACKASIPKTYSNLLHQVQNFYAIFDVVFGPQSRIADTMRLVVEEIEANEDVFSIMIDSDSDFVLKFLFNIDIVVQRFFRHLLSNTIGVQAMNILSELTDMFDSIRNFHYHGPTVPVRLIKIVRPDDQPSQPKHSSSSSSSGSSKKQKIKNNNRDARWTLRTGESFDIFFAQKANVPSILQTPICMKYHILGNCDSKCARASTHIPLSGDAASQMADFVNACRASSSSGPVTSANPSSTSQQI